MKKSRIDHRIRIRILRLDGALGWAHVMEGELMVHGVWNQCLLRKLQVQMGCGTAICHRGRLQENSRVGIGTVGDP